MAIGTDPIRIVGLLCGVSFYKTLDETKLLTSTAQVFNERGEGIILRGGTAQISKEDKQIHLSTEDAYNLLKNALEIYQNEHKNFPARVVIHKSSKHNDEEIAGFSNAMQTYHIEPGLADFVSMTRSSIRLFVAIVIHRYGGLFLTWGKNLLCFTRKGV